MTRVVDVPVELLSHESFSPFGQVLASPKKPTVWNRPGLDAWLMYFGIAVSTVFQVMLFHFQGRMEFGPRALGNRSILADSRNPENQNRVNTVLRTGIYPASPGAPTVLHPHAPCPFQTYCF